MFPNLYDEFFCVHCFADSPEQRERCCHPSEFTTEGEHIEQDKTVLIFFQPDLLAGAESVSRGGSFWYPCESMDGPGGSAEPFDECLGVLPVPNIQGSHACYNYLKISVCHLQNRILPKKVQTNPAVSRCEKYLPPKIGSMKASKLITKMPKKPFEHQEIRFSHWNHNFVE